MVSRECIYYINLRQAYLLSPFYGNRLSSRTVLFTCVPQQYLDEAKLRKVFGDSVKNVWIPRDTDELENLVKERDQTAFRLEKAEITLIKKANAARNTALKNGHPDIEANPGPGTAAQSKETDASASRESPVLPADSAAAGYPELKTNEGFGLDGPSPDINGSVASRWISHSSRPYHRPLANYGRRVDTIKWTRLRLKKLVPRINRLRRQQCSGQGTPMPAVFIEFDSQAEAQSAYQILSHHRPLHMSPRFIGVRPYEIVWGSLRMKWWERIIRRFSIQASITAMIIFWSIPSAIIGTISNIKFLTSKVPFLGWIDHLPSAILGLVSGLLPAVALSLLMAVVPMILRGMSRDPFLRNQTDRDIRLCQGRGRPITVQDRIVYPKCLLRFPGHSGISRNHPDVRGFSRLRGYPRRPHLSQEPPLPESTKSVQLLPLLFPPSVSGGKRRCACPYTGSNNTPTPTTFLKEPKTHVHQMAQTREGPLGKRISSVHQHGCRW